MTDKPRIVKYKSGNPNEDRRSYSRAIAVGDMIFVANTAGRNLKTMEFPKDPAEQTRQCLINLSTALEALGATLADVIRARISIPDVSVKEAILDVTSQAFRGIDPAMTITACPLTSPDYLVEIEVTAYRGAGSDTVERLQAQLGA